MEEITKPCSKCGENLPLSAYSKRDRKITSYTICKQCKAKVNKIYYEKKQGKSIKNL